MFKFNRINSINLIVWSILLGGIIPRCVCTKESSKISNILSGNITGDLVPSAYPVLKINQSANNDSMFQEFYKEELEDLENEVLKLMADQRKVFYELRKKAKDQNKLFDELSVAVQRQ